MTPKPGPDRHAEAGFLRALAHPMRLQILERLLQGELAVSGIEHELDLKQPNLSQQLGALREAGLVATRREAKSIVYSIADDRVAPMLEALRRARGGAISHGSGTAPAPRPVNPSDPKSSGRIPSRGRIAAASSVFGQVGWHLGTDR